MICCYKFVFQSNCFSTGFQLSVMNLKQQSNLSDQSQQTQTTQRTSQNSKQTHVTGVKRRKTRASKSRLVLVSLLFGGESGAKIFNQSQSEEIQTQCKRMHELL